MGKSENLKQAVEDEVLIDVSHIATSIGLLCLTYVTKSFWRSEEIGRCEVRLRDVLDITEEFHKRVAADNFGTFSHALSIPSGHWGIGLTALVDHFDGIGTVVVVGNFEEELDFRFARSGQGGSFFLA